MTDIHSHILYELDDGARDAQESERMLKAAAAMGVERIVATPHVRRTPYHLEEAYQRHEAVAKLAERYGIQLDLGFELNWSALISLDESAYESFCMQDTHHLLLEFSLSAEELPQNHDRMVYRLQRQGIHVIIAHPERYRCVRRKRSIVEHWLDMGCSLQIDAICLLRAYEPGSKAVARALFKTGRYDYLASDAHCAADYERFGRAMEWARRHE